jgi:dipeptidase
MNSLSFEVDGKRYGFERPIATQQTGFVFVGQMRSALPDAVGGVLWFGVDDARFTVFTPMYGCLTETPECYRKGTGDFTHFSWKSAFWVHNWVANMSYSRYDRMQVDAQQVQDRLESGYLAAQQEIERQAIALSPSEAAAYLTRYSVNLAQEALAEWKLLGEYLIVKYMDGTVKKEMDGRFPNNPHGGTLYPDRPAMDTNYLREIVRQTGDRLEEKPLDPSYYENNR